MTEPTTEIAVIIEEAIQSALSSGQKASYSSQISNTVNSTITQVILIILSIATLVTVLDYFCILIDGIENGIVSLTERMPDDVNSVVVLFVKTVNRVDTRS